MKQRKALEVLEVSWYVADETRRLAATGVAERRARAQAIDSAVTHFRISDSLVKKSRQRAVERLLRRIPDAKMALQQVVESDHAIQFKRMWQLRWFFTAEELRDRSDKGQGELALLALPRAIDAIEVLRKIVLAAEARTSELETTNRGLTEELRLIKMDQEMASQGLDAYGPRRR